MVGNIEEIEYKHKAGVAVRWSFDAHAEGLMFEFSVCLFVRGFSSHSGSFLLYGDVTITGEGLQILTFVRHLWPRDTGHPLKCLSPRTRYTHAYGRAFGSGAVTSSF